MELKTPGVYIRDVDTTLPARVRLDIAAFVGQAERGPLNVPQPLTSWGQFRDVFGGFTGFSFLAYTVFGFFLNGGTRCYVVRVAHETARPARRELLDAGNDPERPVIRVTGRSTGAWGNDIVVAVEQRAAGDMILTALTSNVSAGAETIPLQSVAGLVGDDMAGAGNGDTITLIHQEHPFIRASRRIEHIDFTAQTITVIDPLGHEFPAGSPLLGPGFTLRFRYQPVGALVREEVFENLSLSSDHERYFVRVINGDPEEQDDVKRLREGLSILVRVEDPNLGREQVGARPQDINGQHLENGAEQENGPRPLTAPYYTGYLNGDYFRPVPPAADIGTRREFAEKFFGLATCEAILDIGLIAIPDLVIRDLEAFYEANPALKRPKNGIIFGHPSATGAAFDNLRAGQRDMLQHCERMGDRLAILDAPPGAGIGKGSTKIEEWPAFFQLVANSKYGTLYYPWLREKAVDFEGRELLIPPSGHVAGIYARTELAGGVGEAPANAILQGVIDLEVSLSNAEQVVLNPRGVNCLRMLPGRGLRVWGARTLSTDPLWRYVNVRRVYLAIAKQSLLNLQWTVFEPHDRRLWGRIVASLTLFLQDLFRRGALAGTTFTDAFFVKCDDETNPPEVIASGQVITQVGFAPARPAEFILVT